MSELVKSSGVSLLNLILPKESVDTLHIYIQICARNHPVGSVGSVGAVGSVGSVGSRAS